MLCHKVLPLMDFFATNLPVYKLVMNSQCRSIIYGMIKYTATLLEIKIVKTKMFPVRKKKLKDGMTHFTESNSKT